MGVVWNFTRFSPPGSFSSDAAGMLETAISASGSVTVRAKVDLMPGSSQHGRKRLASEFSNWVNRARLEPPAAS